MRPHKTKTINTIFFRLLLWSDHFSVHFHHLFHLACKHYTHHIHHIPPHKRTSDWTIDLVLLAIRFILLSLSFFLFLFVCLFPSLFSLEFFFRFFWTLIVIHYYSSVVYHFSHAVYAYLSNWWVSIHRLLWTSICYQYFSVSRQLIQFIAVEQIRIVAVVIE